MLSVVAFGLLKATGGITVNTAKQARIIYAYIFANYTTTGFTLGRIFLMGDIKPKDSFDMRAIYTLAWRDSVGL